MRTITAIIAVLALVLLAGTGPVPAADFDGDSRDDIAVFRPSTGLWVVRGLTRVYFGTFGDTPAAGDYTGDGVAEIGVFRPTTGLWTIRGVSRIYFGSSGDTALTGGGGGQRLYDYVVKADDGADLVAALQNTTYNSVFIPAGTYPVSQVITVPINIKHVVGESNSSIIQFSADGYYFAVTGPNCHLENLRFDGGGSTASSIGTVYLTNSYATLQNCRSVNSLYSGFHYTADAEFVSFVNCVVRTAANAGFRGVDSNLTSRLVGCSADGCSYGFLRCHNLSSCYASGCTTSGLQVCSNTSSCYAYNCTTNGFYQCDFLSSCRVDGNSTTASGFNECWYVSSSYATGCTNNWINCSSVDPDSTNHP